MKAARFTSGPSSRLVLGMEENLPQDKAPKKVRRTKKEKREAELTYWFDLYDPYWDDLWGWPDLWDDPYYW